MFGFNNKKQQSSISSRLMSFVQRNTDAGEGLLEEDLKYFKNCLDNDKVYFGPVMGALQGVPARHRVMQSLVKQKKEEGLNEISIMEIGTWAGGSALTWAGAVKKFFDNKGSVVCVDPLKSYIDRHIDRLIYKYMKTALDDDYIADLLLHNIKYSGYGDIIKLFRCSSDFLFPMLNEGLVDILFVDGDHTYNAIKKDLSNYLKVVKEGGIICGDDLEMQISDIDVANAEKYLEYDYIQDTKTGEYYHPGVTLAVAETFSENVSAKEGLWAMRKTKGKWENIEMPDIQNIPTPAHLKQEKQ